MSGPDKKRLGGLGCLGGILHVAVALLVVVILVQVLSPPHTPGLWKDVGGAKQILIAMKQYAADHEGRYPDGVVPGLKSANEVFRELFKAGIILDERSFTSRSHLLDARVGSAPDFAEALAPGECRWTLLKGQGDASHPKTPLLVEAPLASSWPPRWDVSQAGFFDRWREGQNSAPGSARKDRTIIIIRNDCTATVEKLRSDGTLDWHSPNNLDEHGKSWIDYLKPEQIAKLEYWDVEER